MIQTLSPTEVANDLLYAIEVLDEYEHLGLDAEYTDILRATLLRRIGEKDEPESCWPAQPIRFPNRA